MMVSIEFLGTQRTITKTDGISMPITQDTRVNDVLEYIRRQYPGLHLEEATILATVNREIASPDRILRPNDTVSFIPSISGG